MLSSRVAGEEWKRFDRHGNGLFVVWDADDPGSDSQLEAALGVARTLCTRARVAERSDVDFAAFDGAIRDVEKQLEGLEGIQKAAETIDGGTRRIQERVRILRKNLERAVETLDECGEAIRREIGEEA